MHNAECKMNGPQSGQIQIVGKADTITLHFEFCIQKGGYTHRLSGFGYEKTDGFTVSGGICSGCAGFAALGLVRRLREGGVSKRGEQV